jgi:short-subunit dehydrogenase involved in D-alanine esterification of teichoic acids
MTARPNVLALVETIRDRYGVGHVLVNNVSTMDRVDRLEESVRDEPIAHEIAVNLTGPILLTRRLLPLLRPGRSSMIVMVTLGYTLLPPHGHFSLAVSAPVWQPVGHDDAVQPVARLPVAGSGH